MKLFVVVSILEIIGLQVTLSTPPPSLSLWTLPTPFNDTDFDNVGCNLVKRSSIKCFTQRQPNFLLYGPHWP